MKKTFGPAKHGFYVRALSPLGKYHADNFLSNSCAYIADPEICMTVIQVTRRDWSFSEVEILTKRELPLYGSLLLGGKVPSPYVWPYPSSFCISLKTEKAEAISPANLAECKSHLLEQIQENLMRADYGSSIFHKPPKFGGKPYDFVANESDTADQQHVLDKLVGANPVILRGVSCLLKGRLAFQHAEFEEAACIYLWIALDAAHSMVLALLRNAGNPNPTSEDAAKYFQDVFGRGMHWEKFFEEDYENRIRAIHPDNRFGRESIPQFLADDFLELNDELYPLYRHLIDSVPSAPDADSPPDFQSDFLPQKPV